MTRRIDWRDGATKADKADVEQCEVDIAEARITLGLASSERKRIISRCYQVARRKAARAAKRGK